MSQDGGPLSFLETISDQFVFFGHRCNSIKNLDFFAPAVSIANRFGVWVGRDYQGIVTRNLVW
jgi:hypothetical protein